MDEPAVSDPDRDAARAALYAALAWTFTFPEADPGEALLAGDARRGLRQAGARLGLDAEVAALCDGLEATDRAALERAYNALFGVPAEDGTYAVPPYEAHYTVGEDVGQQQRRVATVVGLLEAVGLEPADGFHERPDHLAVELEAMQVLAARQAAAVRDGEREAAARLARVQATVLDEHLVGFVPAFAHRVREATDCEAPAAAAALAERLVREDHDRFEAVRREAPAAGGGG